MESNQTQKMKPVKTIAGEMLLYFYLIQRQDVSKLKDAMLSFMLRHFSEDRKQVGAELDRRDNSILNIDEFKNYSDNDLYNAITYLNDSNLINFNDSKDNVGDHIINLKLTSYGIDLIESIERGKEEQNNFNMTFNFNITNNDITVESLLKAEFGSLIKASLI
jgi:hypothetical protein